MNTKRSNRGSQNRHPHGTHFLAALFIAAIVMFSTVPAFAVEAEASPNAPDTEVYISAPDVTEGATVEGDAVPDDEAGDSEATPAPISAPVSTIEELLDAIAHANANDVIEIDGYIQTSHEWVLGRTDCSVTIRRATNDANIFLWDHGEGNIKVQNITFDGAGFQSQQPILSISGSTQTIEKCNFVNCIGSSTLNVGYGNTFISDCHFFNNKGIWGAHLRVESGKTTIENCTFTGGFASEIGSIYIANAEKTFLIGCTISENNAGVQGGGIYVKEGELIIDGCKIYGNTVNGVADDITKSYQSHLSLVDNYAALIELYKPDGVIPNMWTVDSHYDLLRGTTPECADMVFSMTFVDNELVPTPKPEPEAFIVTFNANGGTVSPGSATTNENGTIVLTTPEREGYTFGGWFTEDGTPVTTDTVFTEDMEIYAQWTENKQESLPTSVTLDKSELTLDVGETDTLTATIYPEGRNGIVQWISSNPTVASVAENGHIIAYSAGTTIITATETISGASASCFVNVQDIQDVPVTTYSINASASPAEGGTISGNKQYEEGAIATVTATPNEGFRFLAWTEADAQISTESSLTFTVGSDRNLTAVFESISKPAPKPVYAINVIATVGGAVTGEGTYEQGNSVTLTATPESGYLFIGWMENGEQVSTEETFTFIADRDRTLYADFAPITQPTYTIEVSTTVGGIAEGGGEFEQGSSVTLTAIPDSGYFFVGWTEDGKQISTDEIFAFIVEHDRTLVANFEPISEPPHTTYTVQVKSVQGGAVDGGGSYADGESVTVTAVPDADYRFLRWKENGVQVSTEARYSFTAEADRTLVAIFELIPQSTTNLTTSTPHRPSGDDGKFVNTSTPSQEEIKKQTLNNGKAVLISPDNLFWGGYKTGRGNGTETVTRADLAQLVYYMMDSESVKIHGTTQSSFSDVKPGVWYEPAVGTMRNAGIMLGCGNNLFCPNQTLTWGELLTVFARFTEDKPLTEYYTGKHWAKDSINKAFTFGWLVYTEGFDPGGTVTTSEMVDLIQAVFQWNNE